MQSGVLPAGGRCWFQTSRVAYGSFRFNGRAARVFPIRRSGPVAADRVFEKFRVEMLDSGEFRQMNVVCESKQAAMRVAMNAAKDVRQAEVLDVRPVKVGFC